MREEFEAAFVEEQVLRFGEGYHDSATHMLKRSGDFGFDRAPTQYELNRRKDGLYDMHWVEMVWWAWQASRTALAIQLPPEPTVPDEPEEAIDDSFMDGYYAAQGMRNACAQNIKAAGLKVKP